MWFEFLTVNVKELYDKNFVHAFSKTDVIIFFFEGIYWKILKFDWDLSEIGEKYTIIFKIPTQYLHSFPDEMILELNKHLAHCPSYQNAMMFHS